MKNTKLVWGWIIALSLLVALPIVAADPDLPLERRYPEAQQVMRFLQQRDPQRAMQVANQLVEQDSDQPEPYILRANVFMMTGNGPMAVKDLKKALELTPNDPLAAATLTNLQARMGDLASAEKTVSDALAEYPDSVTLMVAQADLFAAQRKLSQAVKVLEEAAQQARGQSQIVAVNAKLAQAYAQQGKFAQAVDAINKAIDQVPNPQFIMLRANINEKAGNFQAAADDFKQLLNNPQIANHPQYGPQLKQRLVGLQNKLKDEKQKQAQATADAIVPAMSAYLRNPTDAQARAAAIQAVQPYFDQLPTGDMAATEVLLIPTDEAAISYNAENNMPDDLKQARQKAYEQVGEIEFFSSSPQAYLEASNKLLAIYPLEQILQKQALKALMMRDYDLAYEQGMLAEAVNATELQQWPDKQHISVPSSKYFADREIAKFAKRLRDDEATAEDREIVALLDATEQEQWIAVFRQGSSLRAAAKKNPYSRLVAGKIARLVMTRNNDAIQQAHYDALRQARRDGDDAKAKRIVDDMFDWYAHDPQLQSAMLNYFIETGDDERFDILTKRILVNEPYAVRAWLAKAKQAEKQENMDEALLFYNAALTYADEEDVMDQMVTMSYAKSFLGGLEHNLVAQGGKAQGYYQASRKFYKKYHGQKANIRTYFPAYEAAILRYIEALTTPKSKASNYRLLAAVRFDLGNNEGAIEAAKQAINILPTDDENVGKAQDTIAQAYYKMAPRYSNDQAAFERYYPKAITAYQKALELGHADPVKAHTGMAMMYTELGEIDKAMAQYRWIAENAPKTQHRIDAYVQLVELGREHDKSDLAQQKADIDKAFELTQAQDEDDPGSMRMLAMKMMVYEDLKTQKASEIADAVQKATKRQNPSE